MRAPQLLFVYSENTKEEVALLEQTREKDDDWVLQTNLVMSFKTTKELIDTIRNIENNLNLV